MQFTYQETSNIIFGRGCVKENAAKWQYGTNAYIVTGKHSGRASGALEDVVALLKANHTAYEIFEGIGNNPTVEECREVGEAARKAGADYIVGIGGGSPLDAAKAIAVFARNPELPTVDLFKNTFGSVLPLVAIPTTCGTGSEVTPWSVLTRNDLQSKFSFGTAKTMPVVALVDPAYTESLSDRVMVHTVMDAMTHCLESYISIKANPVTEALSLEGLRRFGKCMREIELCNWDDIRDELVLVSLLGGIAIAKTGTTLMHGMGYPLTYFHGLTHGEANCATMPAYLRFVGNVLQERLQAPLNSMQTDIEALGAFVRRCIPVKITLTADEIQRYAAQSMFQGSVRNLPYPVTEEELAGIFQADLGQ